ncbi:hypothetical protein TWF696_003612 [Orbilia brochopaga]|uniref:Uncharacterized protein n=1 Tax=Orbilia brochopaga TaxID=3140254 RepID=A0AAV9TWI3_9PEZI
MQPPATPRYRFPSPDDSDRPKLPAGAPPPAAVKQPQFATPAPLTARRLLDVNIPTTVKRTPATVDGRRGYNRGFSPDPDLYLSTPRVTGTTVPLGKNKRRRSFDLDEIDEALKTSGRPKVLGPSSSGWKGGSGLTFPNATPTPGHEKGKGALSLGGIATPTPAARQGQQQLPPALFQRASTILSSPPENLELSFGDTQEDVQDDSEGAVADGGGGGDVRGSRRQRKRRKSDGVFDDIESIASSLPNGVLGEGDAADEDEVEGSSDGEGVDVGGGELEGGRNEEHRAKGKENATPRAEPTARQEAPLTPPRFHDPAPAATGAQGGTTGTGATGAAAKQWITVPNQPQLNLPPQRGSPGANKKKKLDQAICAMAWSPSHRRRRNANAKYPAGGLAATVLGWAYDAQDAVLRTNAAIEQQVQTGLHAKSSNGVSVVVAEKLWEEEGYVAVVGGAEGRDEKRVVLVGDANSGLRRELRAGRRVEVRAPTWEMQAGGQTWTVAVNWKAG